MESLLLYRRPVIAVIHVVLMIAAYLLAFLLRFEFDLSSTAWTLFLQTIPLLLLTRAGIFAWFHLYEGLWRYVSMRDILAILKAVTLSSLIFGGLVLVIFGRDFSRSILLLDWVFCLALVGGVRLALRAFRESVWRDQEGFTRRALIVGAGDAGEMLIREIHRNSTLKYDVVGIVDDDGRKQLRRIHGLQVMGTIDRIPDLCRSCEVQEILIAIPSATREQRQRILQNCQSSGVTFKTVPSLNNLLQGRARISNLHEVRPEDLLGREEVRLDFDKLRQELQGKRILVTGAGGSIGSELCRQLASLDPGLLVLLDRAESNLYLMDIELKHAHPHLKVVPVVSDILDRRKVEEVIERYAPDILYHAAAYKHVPLMEDHPLEALQNNIFGTEIVAQAALEGRVKKFVFISTDKAVRPVGIMGMTKRIAEGLLRVCNGGPTIFVAVRFGNVLGSDGSVLPLFQWQISRGGPVTVTDPEVSRYFMLISEAAQLVLQAGMMGRGREVFFLDMGEPVRILDLAHNLIRLSGMEPGHDISVEVIGLRPGERLQEELVMEREELIISEHEKVFIVKSHHLDEKAFRQDVETLRGLVVGRDRENAVAQLKRMASRY